MPEVRGSTLSFDEASSESSSATAAGLLPLELAECSGVQSSSSARTREVAGARESRALTASAVLEGSKQTAAWIMVLMVRRGGGGKEVKR